MTSFAVLVAPTAPLLTFSSLVLQWLMTTKNQSRSTGSSGRHAAAFVLRMWCATQRMKSSADKLIFLLSGGIALTAYFVERSGPMCPNICQLQQPFAPKKMPAGARREINVAASEWLMKVKGTLSLMTLDMKRNWVDCGFSQSSCIKAFSDLMRPV